MARNNFDPEAEWTSEGLGWVLCFTTRPDRLDNLPVGDGPGTKGEALRQHFQQCFTRLEGIIEEGVSITAHLSSIGCVFIVGRQEACKRLQKKVETNRMALMCKNMSFFRPA